jgi:hypothetical protein
MRALRGLPTSPLPPLLSRTSESRSPSFSYFTPLASSVPGNRVSARRPTCTRSPLE